MLKVKIVVLHNGSVVKSIDCFCGEVRLIIKHIYWGKQLSVTQISGNLSHSSDFHGH